MINKDVREDIELMESPPLRKTLGSGQLQNNCPLFVWGNPGNFMKSVIRQRNSIFFLYLLDDIVMKQEIKMKVWPVF